MICTEAEAKTKACHQTLWGAKPPSGIPAITCVASACMAWTWTSEPDAERKDEGRGYCGLTENPHAMHRR